LRLLGALGAKNRRPLSGSVGIQEKNCLRHPLLLPFAISACSRPSASFNS
jgi:hypothetical protein